MIVINEISNDFINAYERTTPLDISGTTDITDNEVLIVSLNSKNYDAVVVSGEFLVTVPADDILDLEDNTIYNVTVSWGTEIASEDFHTGEFKFGIMETHSINIVETSKRRFVSDAEIQVLNDRILELEQRTFQQDDVPTVGVTDGDVWIDTVNDTLNVYREYPSGSGVFQWTPFLYKNNDTLDAGFW